MPPIAPPSRERIEQMPINLEGIGFVPEQLEPFVPRHLNTDGSLHYANDVEEFLGFKGEIPVVIQAADKMLFVVDIRSHPADHRGWRGISIAGTELFLEADFLLISPDDWDKEGVTKGFKGLRQGEPFVFGRGVDKAKDRFDLSSNQVSRDHFTITYQNDGELVIEDMDSSNGTAITESNHRIVAEQTIRARDRVAERDGYREPDGQNPYGYLHDAHIIGRRSPKIKGGVYLGGGPREAITVKPDQDPRIEAVYTAMTKQRVLTKLVRRALGRKESTIDQLQTVYNTVQSIMKYDGPAVEALSSQYRGDQLVSLGEYIEKGIGVCRHQGLLAAYLVERLIEDGKIDGRVRVERNTILEYGGAHAWGAYIDPSGKEYVIDAAQNFVGTKKEARAQSRRWDYYLPLR